MRAVPAARTHVSNSEGGAASELERRERFRLLYDATYERVLGYALRRADNAEDAHDIVNETFLVAWRRLDDVPSGDRAPVWLYGTARRVLANFYRGRRRNRRLVAKLETEESGQADGGTADGPEMDGVATAFSRLSTSDQDLLLLVGWEELNTDELASVLGCRASTARVRLHRARKRFSRELDREGLKQDGTPGHIQNRWATARPDPEEAL